MVLITILKSFVPFEIPEYCMYDVWSTGASNNLKPIPLENLPETLGLKVETGATDSLG